MGQCIIIVCACSLKFQSRIFPRSNVRTVRIRNTYPKYRISFSVVSYIVVTRYGILLARGHLAIRKRKRYKIIASFISLSVPSIVEWFFHLLSRSRKLRGNSKTDPFKTPRRPYCNYSPIWRVLRISRLFDQILVGPPAPPFTHRPV